MRVRASSVNPVDAYIAGGVLNGMVEHEFPVVLGRDYAGVVEQAGSAVTGYAVGDEVFGFLPHGSPGIHDGTWAELILVSEDRSVARRPASADAAAAGAAPLAAITALAAHDALDLGKGATVLVVGASGGVGSFAVQLAAAGAAGEGPGRTNVGAAPTTENLERLAGLLEDGTLSVPIQASYPLAQVDQALKDLAGQHTQGKLAVTLP